MILWVTWFFPFKGSLVRCTNYLQCKHDLFHAFNILNNFYTANKEANSQHQFILYFIFYVYIILHWEELSQNFLHAFVQEIVLFIKKNQTTRFSKYNKIIVIRTNWMPEYEKKIQFSISVMFVGETTHCRLIIVCKFKFNLAPLSCLHSAKFMVMS